MKRMIVAVVIAASLAALTSNAQQQEGKTRMEKIESPFFCRLDALTAEERERHLALWKRLQQSRQEIREIKDGYAIRFPGDARHLLDLAEFISRERRCCPFFTFELEVSGEDKPLWLRLRGDEGVKEFLKAQIGIK